MRFELTDPKAARQLVRHLRVTGYLAVERGPGIVEAVPIRALSKDADRVRTIRDVERWAAEHGAVEARPLADEDV